MKQVFLKNEKPSHLLLCALLAVGMLLFTPSCKKKDAPIPVFKVSVIATGLIGPIGLEVDKKGWVWVAEAGTGNNDGKVSAISPNGTKYAVIVDFESVINAGGGEAEGPSHLLFADDLLYILGTGGKMYKADLSSLKPGVATIEASSLKVENIGAFVLAQNLGHPTGESHPYNLTIGPSGAIYIADAAANAILRRDKNGVLGILAEVPGIPNTTSNGPDPIESVPTGIYYDGQNFLVTTLLGYPFPMGKAIIYKVSPSGYINVYQQGFTSLVDIAEGGSLGRLVLEHGTFGPTRFIANTGRLVWANGTTSTVLLDGLNQPAGLKQADEHTWYVTSFGDNTVLKVTY